MASTSRGFAFVLASPSRRAITGRPLRQVARPRSPAALRSTRVFATSVPSDASGLIRVSHGGTASEVSSGSILGSGGDASVTVSGADVDSEHAKLELRQGRIFLTALSKDNGTFLNGSKLFPGVAYAVAEGATVVLGDGDGAAEVTVAQVNPGSTGGVDMMAKMMQMQFEASMTPEVKAALKEDD